MRHLDSDEVFPDGACPVCKHDGCQPARRKHAYLVPSHGFTTDLTAQGEDLSFDRPERIPASRVLFVPQHHADDSVIVSLGSGTARVEVRTTERADFFVFNDGDDPSGVGFRLCKICDRQVTLDKKGKPESHKTPFGKDCHGSSYEAVHLGHDFITCAARLMFAGANQPYDAQGFWLSLLYAVLGGMSDALGIENGDVNGVIRPIALGEAVSQELVIFDDVPGGAGHSLRLEAEEELLNVLRAAHARVANCQCGEGAACYACLRSYRNQFCHDLLSRGPVADYLARLIESLTSNAADDRPYELPHQAGVIRAALRDANRVDVVATRLTDTGPPEGAPWYVQFLELASREGIRLRIALAEATEAVTSTEMVPFLALSQAGAELYCLRAGSPVPPYSLLAVAEDAPARRRSVGIRWGDDGNPVSLDGETLRRPMWLNRNPDRLRRATIETDEFFTKHAEPLVLRDVITSDSGCVVHAVGKAEPISFPRILASLAGTKVKQATLQDPYLLTEHQMKCLADFLAAVPWKVEPGKVPFRLLTHLADGDPRSPGKFSVARQKKEIGDRLAAPGCLDPKVEFRSKKYAPLHMRFAHFALDDGNERLYMFERGLDMADDKTGKSRNDSYVLEFSSVPEELNGILSL
jgi:hypothetical protein